MEKVTLAKNEAFFIYLVAYSVPQLNLAELEERTAILNSLFEVVNKFEMDRKEIQQAITLKNRQFLQNDAIIQKQANQPKFQKKVDELKNTNKGIADEMENMQGELEKLGQEQVDVTIDRSGIAGMFEKSVKYFFGEDPVTENISGRGDMEIYLGIYNKLATVAPVK